MLDSPASIAARRKALLLGIASIVKASSYSKRWTINILHVFRPGFILAPFLERAINMLGVNITALDPRDLTLTLLIEQ